MQKFAFTPSQVRALAPDAATLERAEGLANIHRWQSFEGNEQGIWATLKSGGWEPYQAVVDFRGPAFKCSCPVRRIPCKHALGLLLFYLKEPGIFNYSENPPEWIAAWLAARAQKRAPAPQVKSEAAEQNELQRSKNRADRIESMKAGMDDLENWLLDLLRQGLASATASWEPFAARMVDAKLGSIGKRIRALERIRTQSTEWADHTLQELAEIYLCLRAFRQLDRLSPGLQEDVFNYAGLFTRKEELLRQETIYDDWLVVGQVEGVDEDPNLRFRRVWLYGRSRQQFALLLDYAFGSADFPQAFVKGSLIHAEIVYYPSAYPQRAVLVSQSAPLNAGATALPFFPDFSAFGDALAQAIAANPWLAIFPVLFQGVIPVVDKHRWGIVDAQKNYLPLFPSESGYWSLLALSAGNPIDLFGEWSDGYFLPT